MTRSVKFALRNTTSSFTDSNRHYCRHKVARQATNITDEWPSFRGLNKGLVRHDFAGKHWIRCVATGGSSIPRCVLVVRNPSEAAYNLAALAIDKSVVGRESWGHTCACIARSYTEVLPHLLISSGTGKTYQIKRRLDFNCALARARMHRENSYVRPARVRFFWGEGIAAFSCVIGVLSASILVVAKGNGGDERYDVLSNCRAPDYGFPT